MDFREDLRETTTAALKILLSLPEETRPRAALAFLAANLARFGQTEHDSGNNGKAIILVSLAEVAVSVLNSIKKENRKEVS